MASKWIKDTFASWLAQINDINTLNEFTKMIDDRHFQIKKDYQDRAVTPMLEALKACKPGDTLYLIKPYTVRGQQPLRGRARETEVEKITFYKFQSRVKRLWFDDPRDGTRICRMSYDAIKRYQPSRCPAKLRKPL